ncbi:hypothetical protein [Micromonospora sp. CB01531]|uniref:hypothetical protein n=1 Tax=Micromonospora sp. CB01531 TaxID=1718947 RepID=UPI00093FDEDD|nr:hypothetical protein [Micromonospora sp. CB01531]OKI65575.1 hypothetical protein A6A27_24700 [Micromonospora sp. CB01531]
MRIEEDGQGWVTPTVVAVSMEGLRAHSGLLEDCFGPLTILVECSSHVGAAEAVPVLFRAI